MSTDRQHRLPFDPPKELARIARVQRLVGSIPKLKTAAKLFDQRAYDEASALARRAG